MTKCQDVQVQQWCSDSMKDAQRRTIPWFHHVSYIDSFVCVMHSCSLRICNSMHHEYQQIMIPINHKTVPKQPGVTYFNEVLANGKVVESQNHPIFKGFCPREGGARGGSAYDVTHLP